MWMLVALLVWLLLCTVTAVVFASVCAAGHQEDVRRGLDGDP
jgi:hypothetical protein